MIFRWSVWGEDIVKNIELLRYSILSFRKRFGNNHRYIVYTDSSNFVSRQLDVEADVKRFHPNAGFQFCITSKATWLKWCPSPRLDINQVEFHIDSDVFLLKYPEEIDSFLYNPKMKFAIMDEFLGQPFQHGAMHKKATKNTPFVNAGFFIQKAGHNISKDLIKEFNWWQKNIKNDEQTHHDEQGALSIALTKYLVNNELFILPKKKYIIISPTSNSDIKNLNKITLFHATYRDHPAFYKFKHTLKNILSG